MFKEARFWLGPERLRGLFLLLGTTGLASLIIRVAFADAAWSTGAQTAFLMIFLVGALVIIGSRLPPSARRRLAIRFAPALLALLLGLVFPKFFQLFAGAALGWLLVAQFSMRDTEKPEYKTAIKAMRKRDYAKAADAITGLIRRDPEDSAHYNFRAQLYRLNDDLRRARADYQKVIELSPETGVGQNGLAEICLQEGGLEEARHWGEAAYQNTPGDWVAVYNLGMIAERQGDETAARDYLEEALKLGLPDSRHRLLAKLWLIKAYYRQGENDKAQAMVTQIRREKSGLREWRTILESKEAETMRHLLAEDVELAEQLVAGKSLEEVFDVG